MNADVRSKERMYLVWLERGNMITAVIFFLHHISLNKHAFTKIPSFLFSSAIFSGKGKKGKIQSAAKKTFSKVLHYFVHEQPFLSPRVNLSELIGKRPLLPNKAVFPFREEEGK